MEDSAADAEGSQPSVRRHRVAVRKVPASKLSQDTNSTDDFVDASHQKKKTAGATKPATLAGRPSTRATSGGTSHCVNATNKDEEKKTNYPTVRCAPGPMVNILQSMSPQMKERLQVLGFKDFLGFNLEGIDDRGLACFLMHHVEMDPFRIEVEGRVLPLTPHVVKCFSASPMGQTLYRLFLLRKSTIIRNVGEVGQYDLCTAIIDDLRIKVGKWKKSSSKQTPSVQGCVILFMIYYLDNLRCPQHMLREASSTPRATHLTAAIADKLAKADRKILTDDSSTYGKLPFRSKMGTCYENVRGDDPPLQMRPPSPAVTLKRTRSAAKRAAAPATLRDTVATKRMRPAPKQAHGSAIPIPAATSIETDAPPTPLHLMARLADLISQIGNSEQQEALAKALREHDQAMDAAMKKVEEGTRMVSQGKSEIHGAHNKVVHEIRMIFEGAAEATATSSRADRARRRGNNKEARGKPPFHDTPKETVDPCRASSTIDGNARQADDRPRSADRYNREVHYDTTPPSLPPVTSEPTEKHVQGGKEAADRSGNRTANDTPNKIVDPCSGSNIGDGNARLADGSPRPVDTTTATIEEPSDCSDKDNREVHYDNTPPSPPPITDQPPSPETHVQVGKENGDGSGDKTAPPPMFDKTPNEMEAHKSAANNDGDAIARAVDDSTSHIEFDGADNGKGDGPCFATPPNPARSLYNSLPAFDRSLPVFDRSLPAFDRSLPMFDETPSSEHHSTRGTHTPSGELEHDFDRECWNEVASVLREINETQRSGEDQGGMVGSPMKPCHMASERRAEQGKSDSAFVQTYRRRRLKKKMDVPDEF